MESAQQQIAFLMEEYLKCHEQGAFVMCDRIRKKIENLLTGDTASLTIEEQYLFDVVKSARTIQEFQWGDYNGQWNLEEWRRMFRKRIQKIDDIDSDNPHANIEMKKRLMQNAALCIALLAMIHNGTQPVEGKCDIPSNLPQYAGKCEDPKSLPKSALI